MLQAVEKLANNRRLEQERDALHAKNAAMVEQLKKLNTRLESKVRGRTLQLSKANDKLKTALAENREKNLALTLLNESLNIQATVDALTGLFNRRELNSRLHAEWGRFKRHGHPLSMIMFDIDFFKRVNDDHGHECGDRVLQMLGELVRRQQRRQDIACRFGGEEFVVLLPETGLDAAFTVAESLRSRVAKHPFRCGRSRLAVRISLGVAGAAEHAPANEDDFVKVADLGLYRAKGEGRNRTVIVEPGDRGAILRMSARGLRGPRPAPSRRAVPRPGRRKG
jgi:diguanylate cyclase (GGDEF)-like protein